ncbi:MAG: Glutamyl-tRNA(Gln) amidotransferase subunit A [Candidatus Nomurabacteria bacterium GW2011_GWF2_35_66]|nr:MAG: Glutamyl-tRNA(Gln) amidotransferase subunit A [Candidatus Nomurabacteria bacterium GW2011_GWF2_35_66]HBM45409.1 Asp-tRNA(Asn)/Glu-tRNA(Gln) amidotransferase GatCAB subunit A [Patescibacteria group bacterium]
MEIKDLTIKKAVESIKAGDFSATELTETYLKNIENKDGDIGAYLEVFDDALDIAKSVDERVKKGDTTGALLGVPMAFKDNILIEGKTCSAGSKILENYKATYDATVISRLKKEGIVILGRTNMDEFAMGSSTENSAYKITKNPHDLSLVPGGSSGGSASSIASDMALGALGSDTGGSVRQPASFCGIVGLKPTYGAVSRNGVVAMGSSLDQIGSMAHKVEDAEAIFDVIRGIDSMDSTTREYPNNSDRSFSKKIGVPRKFLEEGLTKEVEENFNKTIENLKSLGYEIVDVDLPNIGYSLPAYYVVMPAEVSANLARFDGVRYGSHKDGANLLEDYIKTRGDGFGPEVRRRIILGTYVLSSGYYDAYYKKAEEVRGLIKNDFAKIFNGADAVSAIITPTTPSPAFKIGEKTGDPLKMYLEDIFTVPANIAGVPAISVPSGFAEKEGKNLPLGVQLTAPHFREDILFSMGKDIEKTQE